jgi:predicted DNA-binding protein (MmcQ/YjbR family)
MVLTGMCTTQPIQARVRLLLHAQEAVVAQKWVCFVDLDRFFLDLKCSEEKDDALKTCMSMKPGVRGSSEQFCVE